MQGSSHPLRSPDGHVHPGREPACPAPASCTAREPRAAGTAAPPGPPWKPGLPRAGSGPATVPLVLPLKAKLACPLLWAAPFDALRQGDTSAPQVGVLQALPPPATRPGFYFVTCKTPPHVRHWRWAVCLVPPAATRPVPCVRPRFPHRPAARGGRGPTAALRLAKPGACLPRRATPPRYFAHTTQVRTGELATA